MAFEIGVGGRKKVRIAGCKVRNGVVGMRSRVRVLRGGRRCTMVRCSLIPRLGLHLLTYMIRHD